MEVNFEEDKFNNNASRYEEVNPSSKGIIGAMIKMGLAKNAKQANLLMIVAIVILTIVMYVLWPSSDAAPVNNPNFNDSTITP